MYKIQNCMSGNLPVDLEVGSIVLKAGQSFDLESYCSRKWIKTNPLLKKLLASNALVLVHDSEVGIPKVPIKKVVPIAQKVPAKLVSKLVKPKVAKKPKVLDLKDKEDVTAKTYKKPKTKTRTTKSKTAKSKTTKSKKKTEDPVEQLLAEKDSKKTKKYSWHKKSKKDAMEYEEQDNIEKEESTDSENN